MDFPLLTKLAYGAKGETGMAREQTQENRSTAERIRDRLEQAVFTADFETAAQFAAKVLIQETSDTADAPERFESLRLRALAAEVFDFMGRYRDARTVIRSVGESCQRTLELLHETPSRGPGNDEERRLLKQRIWVVLHWGTTFYRRGQLIEARQRFRLCQAIAERHLVDTAEGTMAWIHYLIGLVDRESYDYRGAKHNFTESMQYAWRSHSQGNLRTAQEPRSPRPLRLVNLARCLGLGLAWIHYTEGSVELATPLLLAAKSLLRSTEEPLIGAYIDVVWGCVLRSRYGDDARLLEAHSLLRRSYARFRRRNHLYYMVRAQHQLAPAHLQRALNERSGPRWRRALNCAEAYGKKMRVTATELGDFRFRSIAKVILSLVRLRLGQPIEAEHLAMEALEEGGAEYIQCRIDALLAKGEARMHRGLYPQACSDFEAALEAGKKNPKISAMCYLYLTQAYAKDNDIRKATENHSRWLKLTGKIETATVRRLAFEADKALRSESEDFTLRLSATEMNPKEAEAALRAFMVKWAQKNSKTDAEAQSLLRISKQTYYNWKSSNRRK